MKIYKNNILKKLIDIVINLIVKIWVSIILNIIVWLSLIEVFTITTSRLIMEILTYFTNKMINNNISVITIKYEIIISQCFNKLFRSIDYLIKLILYTSVYEIGLNQII